MRCQMQGCVPIIVICPQINIFEQSFLVDLFADEFIEYFLEGERVFFECCYVKQRITTVIFDVA